MTGKGMESAVLGMLLSKLKDPHPTVQRYAVRSVFEALKEDMGSKAAQQALADCMLQASHSLPALDEALSQLCGLVMQAEALTASVLAHLQAALECVPAQAVPSVIRSIGFVCRHLLSNHSPTLLSFQSCELHPFVKAFRSRKEAHLEILQQVLTVLTHDDLIKDPDALQFLQPYLKFVFLQPLAQTVNLVAARELFFSLASLVSLNSVLGTKLTRWLTNYTYLLTSQTTKEADWKFLILRELVDAIETLVMHASMRVNDCKQIVSDVQLLLIDTCYDSKKHGFSLLPCLELLGRIVQLQKVLETTLFWRHKILCLAHFLAVADLKEEQIALISLARKVLRKMNEGGMDMLIESTFAFPSALLWVFPTTNIISSSCASLRNNAASLLQDLEDLLALYWTQRGATTTMPPMDVCAAASYGQLADNVQRILLNLWFDRGCWKTWTLLESIADWKSCEDHDTEYWILRLSSYVESQLKLFNPSSPKACQWSHFSSWICMLVSVMLIHPVHSNATLKVISGIAKGDTVSGFSLVPVVLFYLKTWKSQCKGGDAGVLFRLMKVLPSLAVHPMSSTVVAETVQSLIHLNGHLQGTGIRLLCKTWEISDKVYPHLEVQLDHSHFLGSITDFQMTLSRAASLCDVCKRDAHLGVELILSIQACIESESATIQAFGLQSLSCLCHYDVIDFYTAWEMLNARFSDFPEIPQLAESLCGFLQNGSLDAAAYSEMSNMILQILWKAATIVKKDKFKWWIVREKALNALESYEVDDLNRSLGEVRGRHIQILLSEENTEVLRACEKLVVKFLCHEFEFRHRGQVIMKHTDSKLGKFFAAMPQLFATSVQKKAFVMQSPAAFLLLKCYKEGNLQKSQSSTKSMLQAWEVDFEEQFIEMANRMNLQGNLILALLNLDPWCSFINEQIIESNDCNTSGTPSSNAMFQLMKNLCKLAGEAIPRVAENAILALAAIYQVSQATLDSLVDSIVDFLKSCLSQAYHEYLQWTSALALGYVAQHCNTADWRLKLDVSTWLLECFCTSDRDVVRGACGLGLGFVLHNLFTQNDGGNCGVEAEGVVHQRELHLLALISQNLVHFLSVWCPELTESLQKFKMHTAESLSSKLKNFCISQTTMSLETESKWTISGLAMALGSSVVAFERIGDLESLTHVTKFLLQGIHLSREKACKDIFFSLALGSFISLPLCIRSCLRLELLTEELDALLQDVKDFLYVSKHNESLPAELRMAACLGSGNILAILLYAGTRKVVLEDVQWLLESMKSIALDNISALSSLGGYLGLANALGAGAALMVPSQNYRLDELKAMPEIDGGFEPTYVSTPLLYESSCKILVQDLTQFLVNTSLQGSSDAMSNARWALALIRRGFIDHSNANQSVSGFGNAKFSRISLTSLPKESSLYVLCSWLLNIGKPMVNSSFPFHTVASVLRCLKAAPQLPHLDWGTLLRQMLHEASSKDHHNVVMRDAVCRECVLFSLAHSHKLPSLQALLDELCDLSGLLSARTSVSSVLMLHMMELSSIFSRSRMEKFFTDSVEVTCRASKSQSSFSADAGWQLRTSFWKGLKALLSQMKEGLLPCSIDRHKISLGAGKCLCLLESPLKQSENRYHLVEEWSEALDSMCLLASPEWILKPMQFDWEGPMTTVQDVASMQKSVFILSQMVARHIQPPSALVKPVQWLCNQDASCEPEVLQQLLWITCALKDVVMEEKQQWLLEAIETASCLKNPETGVLFLALLVSCWCSYAPLLLIDSHTPIQLLQFTLPLLLSEESWRSTSTLVVQKCGRLLEAAADAACGSTLWYVKRACMKVRSELPVADQLSFSLLAWDF